MEESRIKVDLSRYEAGDFTSHGNPAGKFNIIAPDVVLLYGQPKLAYRLPSEKQRYECCLLRLPQSVFLQQAVLGKPLFNSSSRLSVTSTAAVFSALCAMPSNPFSRQFYLVKLTFS